MTLDWGNIKQWDVLLIDDEPDNLEVIAESLEFYGISVKTAINGEVGLGILKNWMPTLVLLDLSMPTMDGWETLRRIKSDPRTRNLPVLALSAHAMLGDSKRALDVGFDGYLTKPINIPTLIQDMRSAFKEPKPTDTPNIQLNTNSQGTQL